MKTVVPLLALALLVGSAPAKAFPLQTTAGVAAWYDGDVPVSSFRLAPTLALDGTHAVLVGGAMLAGSDMQTPYRGARLAGAWIFAPIERLPLELRVSTAHRDGPHDPSRGLLRAEGRLNFAAPNLGGWMALATERAIGIDGHVINPMMGFGAWTRHHGLTLSVDLEQRSGLLPHAMSAVPDTDRTSGVADGSQSDGGHLLRVALTTTRASLHWQAARLEVESVGGITLSLLREPRRWAQASAAYQVAPDIAMFTTFGSRDPELYLIEPADTPRATLGLKLSNWRSASLDAPLVARAGAVRWQARRLEGQSWTLEVRAPGARLVEVTGDFTQWEPLRLDHSGGDRWQTTVMLEPGVHQVNLRVDGGAWMPPPGAPTTADGYGGTTGVVVAE